MALPLSRIEKVVEKDTSDSPSRIASPLPADPGDPGHLRLVDVRRRPSERLLAIGSLWDSVMSQARQAVDSLDQLATYDPDAMSEIRAMQRLVVMETRFIRAKLSQFTPSKTKKVVLPGYATAPRLSG